MEGYSLILIANLKNWILVAIVAFTVCNGVTNTNAQISKEKISVLIGKLRKSILPHIPPTSYVYEYSKHDLYLAKWLEDSSYNLERTQKQLMSHLKWRSAEKIDSILEENWSEEWRNNYPIYLDTVDKIGTPIGEAWFSEWNVRRAVVTGQTQKLNRWVARLAEIQTRRLYGARVAGLNVTHALLLWDFEGFNLVDQGCTPCTSIYINMAQTYEAQYPGLWGGIVLVNMNQAFDSILSTMQPFLKPGTKKVMHSFYSKKRWMAMLDKLIDRKQRSVRFGGTIQRD